MSTRVAKKAKKPVREKKAPSLAAMTLEMAGVQARHGERISTFERLNSMLMHLLVEKGVLAHADIEAAAPHFGLTYRAPEPAPAEPRILEGGDGC